MEQGPIGRCKVLTKKVLWALSSRCARRLNASPRLRAFFITSTKRLGLYDRLAIFLRHASAALKATTPRRASSEELDRALKQLPPPVRQAYRDLNTAINKRETH